MIIYNGERVHPNFTDRLCVATSDSRLGHVSRLEINDLQLFDAGIYVCRDSQAAKYNRTIELVTLGKMDFTC